MSLEQLKQQVQGAKNFDATFDPSVVDELLNVIEQLHDGKFANNFVVHPLLQKYRMLAALSHQHQLPDEIYYALGDISDAEKLYLRKE